MPAACQSSLLHPSTFAFRGFEGAKRQRLCQPSGNPLGPNLAGVFLFRMRAHRWRWGLWRAFGMADAARFCWGPLRPPNQCLPDGAVTCLWNGWCRTVLLRAVTFAQPMPAACQSFLSHPSTFAFTGLEGAKQQRLCRPSDPVGVNLAGVSLFRMRAHGWRWGLWRAFGMADAARFCSGPLRPPNQCLPLAKASCFNRPPWLLVGVKVPNGSGSADLVATRWAWILLGFPCFGCVLTGDAGGCDVPQPFRAAQGRYVRPTNACCLPKLPASPVHLCFLGGGNPLGPNLAGVSLFRMRAHRWRWGLWRAFGTADAARFCSRPLRPPNQCLLLAKASWAWILPGFPCFGCVLTADAGGCWGFPVSDACLP